MKKSILTSLGMSLFAFPVLAMESMEENFMYGLKTGQMKFEFSIDFSEKNIKFSHTVKPSTTHDPYLKILNISLPNQNKSLIRILAPRESSEKDFEEAIKESFNHINSPEQTELLEQIAKETIAYSLASKFVNALEENKKDLATPYAISAILNGAHLIDESFLYTIYDINPNIIESIEKKSTMKDENYIASNWKTDDEEVFKPIEKVVEKLISFQKPNSNRKK